MRKSCEVCAKGYDDPYRSWYEHYIPHVCSSKCFTRLIYEGSFEDVNLMDDPMIHVFTKQLMRSNYERRFNKWLHDAGIQHKHEPYKFEFSSKERYVPDFLVLGQVFFEVKGIWTADGKRKFLKFKKEYPTISIYVLDLKALALITRRQK